MTQRIARLLVLVTAMGVLLLHGADARGAAGHDAAAAVPVAHEHRDPGDVSEGSSLHWHHAAIACVAILVTAGALAARRRPARRAIERVRAAVDGPAVVRHPAHRRPRPWLQLGVILR